MVGELPEEQSLGFGDLKFTFSPHALSRLEIRGITSDEVAKAILSGESFQYFHEGVWKDGYYDSQSRLFVGVIDNAITTVIRGATAQYIANLKAGAP